MFADRGERGHLLAVLRYITNVSRRFLFLWGLITGLFQSVDPM